MQANYNPKTRNASIPPCPQAGHGVHSWLLTAANILRNAGTPSSDAPRILRQLITRRPSPANEVEQAVAKAYSEKLDTHRPYQKPPPKWPAVNTEQVEAITRNCGLADLLKASPLRVDGPPYTEHLIDALFPGNPILCCGQSQSAFDTKPRDVWRGELAKLQFIVPSPMLQVTGTTLDGRISKHCLGNTGPRRFLVVEFDSGTTDQQAAVLLHLASRAPLAMVLHSGGKSLHGWFYCAGQPDDKLQRFFRYAVSLGADRATWTRSQFVRMPDGMRENGKRQAVYYFNPKTLLK